jgi:tripartite-type tricarboxylate transporter receptor subunit TctC
VIGQRFSDRLGQPFIVDNRPGAISNLGTEAVIRVVHVPYRGGSQQAITDMLSGNVQVMFDPIASSIEHLKSGQLRALAVTAPKRIEALPDVPALSEFVPGYEAVGWLGIAAAKDAPTDVVDALNRELNAALADPVIKARLAQLGGIAFPQSGADFAKFVADETEKWAKVVKFAGIKAD